MTQVRNRDEPILDWLKRAMPPGCEPGLRLLEQAKRLFPIELQKGIQSRLASRRDSDHVSVVVELLVALLFFRMDFEVVPEHALPGGSKPELLLRRAGIDRCYVECACLLLDSSFAQEESDAHFLGMSVAEQLRDHRFGFWVESYEPSNRTPSARRFAEELDRWVRGLNVETVCSKLQTEGREGLPLHEYRDENSGWEFRLRAWPRPLSADKLTNAFVVRGRGGCVDVGGAKPLRRVIDKKLRQHRSTNLPLVLVVTSSDFLIRPDSIEIAEALFGTSAWHFGREPGAQLKYRRKADGAWSKPTSTAASRLAGLIYLSDCRVETLAQGLDATLWENPHMPCSLLPEWTCARYARATECNEIRFAPGRTCASILDLE